MRSLCLALALVAACGGNNSGSNGDANNGGGDSPGGGGDTPGGNPTTVTVTLKNLPGTPATYTFLAAYQDGAGAWQLAPAPSGETYSFTINAPVWGFAWTCIVPNSNPAITRVELAYFTVAEKTSLTETIPAGCTDKIMNVGLGGTVANLNNGGNGFRAYFNTSNRAVMTTGQFGVETPPGMHDLFIAHGAFSGTGLATDNVLRTTATAPQSGLALDWANAVAVQTATATAPQGAAVGSTLYSAGGTQLGLSVAGGNTPDVVGLDATQATAGDIYQFTSTTRAQGASEVAESWTTTFAGPTFTAVTPLGAATAMVANTMPYPIVMTTWAAYANAVGYAWDARQGANGTAGAAPTEWTAIIGPGYVGASPAFQMPDLSMLAGWSASFQLVTGSPVIGTVLATTSSAGATDFPTVNPAANGTTRTLATSGWTVTP